MCPARWTELRHAPGATASSRTRAGWRHNDETSRTGGKDLECGDLSPLFRFGDLSPKQGRVQRPARIGRLPAFDGDKSPAESADKSAHSKVVAAPPRWAIRGQIVLDRFALALGRQSTSLRRAELVEAPGVARGGGVGELVKATAHAHGLAERLPLCDRQC